jgi:tRNA threonylcarbamoyl adenosine modification protein YeaZ
MESNYSIAIETSCRAGGVALGRGDELLQVANFDASYRQATQLVVRLEELLKPAGIRPRDLAALYVSTGPGSFTGLRVGITVARTLAQANPSLRVVAVPTIQAVAENARHLPWENLGVALDFKDGQVYAGLFSRGGERVAGILPARPGGVPPPASSSVSYSSAATSSVSSSVQRECNSSTTEAARGQGALTLPSPGGRGVQHPHPTLSLRERGEEARVVPIGEPALVPPEEFLARAPRPLLLIGEALELVKIEAPGVTLAPSDLYLPSPEGVWRVGRRLAAAGAFTDFRQLLPLYSRKPEAVRLWEKRNPQP